ncbi:MAG: ubiquitin-conjugating enzyme E2 [Mariniblastus sp.]|nr:ubiquitin-conjugating enzyme E2 [Mariniblastus sp.]
MAESTIFSCRASNNPPQKYRLIFNGAGLQRNRDGVITVSQHHEVLVELGAAYPRMVPNLAWQTPIFHPNISNNGVVCLGGYGTHWVPSLTLSEMCTMLWDMIRYNNFDTESPYNREAALWAKAQTDFTFPIDKRSIRDRISGKANHNKPIADHAHAARVNVDSAKSVNEVIEDGIEIIETGIEIIEIKTQDTNDEIIFLD